MPMQPVLFSVAGQTISSLGLFLVLALLAGLFVIWRLINFYDLDKDKTIDIVILTFVAALISARVYFILFHPAEFNTLAKVALFNRYPGLSFWGGLFGGILALWYLAYRNKYKFWQLADYLIVASFLAISITSLGCLLGSCQYGLPSNLFFAVRQIGLIERRFPLQLLESILFLTFFFYLWKKVIRFHFNGQIASKGLIWLGILKFLLEFLRGDSQKIVGAFGLGHIYSAAVLALGIYAYYTQSTRRLVDDLGFIISLISRANRRKLIVSKLKKSWYNFMVDWKLRVTKFGKKLPRRLNVKANPKEF